MEPKLADVLAEEWEKIPADERDGKDGFEVECSAADKDPYTIV